MKSSFLPIVTALPTVQRRVRIVDVRAGLPDARKSVGYYLGVSDAGALLKK
jgi:hypothetical protein